MFFIVQVLLWGHRQEKGFYENEFMEVFEIFFLQ